MFGVCACSLIIYIYIYFRTNGSNVFILFCHFLMSHATKCRKLLIQVSFGCATIKVRHFGSKNIKIPQQEPNTSKYHCRYSCFCFNFSIMKVVKCLFGFVNSWYESVVVFLARLLFQTMHTSFPVHWRKCQSEWITQKWLYMYMY